MMERSRRRLIWVGLVMIILMMIAFNLRMINLNEGMHFAGDEGRDALVASEIFLQGKIPMIGPAASVGDFSLGPVFYYYLGLWLYMFDGNPVGGGVMMVVLDVFTVLFLYFLGKELRGRYLGIAMAAVWTVMPVAIMMARWPWNPNGMSFFVVFGLWLLLRLVRSRGSDKWVFMGMLGAVMGIMVQMHATAFVFLAIVGGYLLFKIRSFGWQSIVMFCGVILMFNLPFIVYEISTRYVNSRGFWNYLLGEDEAMSKIRYFGVIFEELLLYFSRYFGVNGLQLGVIIALGIIICIVATMIVFFMNIIIGKSSLKNEIRMVMVSIVLSFGFLFWWFGEKVYYHYLVIFGMVAFIILFDGLFVLWKNKYGKVGVGIVVLCFMINNVNIIEKTVVTSNVCRSDNTIGEMRREVREINLVKTKEVNRFFREKVSGQNANGYLYLFELKRLKQVPQQLSLNTEEK